MRRIALALASALTLGTLPSPATTTGPVSLPPYTNLNPGAGSSISYPCTVLSSPVAPLAPNAATGRIDASFGVSVQNCASHGGYRDDTWKIADAPADLVGRRATVVAVILVDGVQAVQSGTVGTRSAVYKLKIAEREWVVMSVDCSDEGCHHAGNTLGPVMFPLGVTYDQLPATIEMTIHREANVIAPSGGTVTASVGVEVRATLQAVLIHSL